MTTGALASSSQRQRVLIVEDESLMLMLLVRLLNSCHYTVVGTAENGQEGIEKARETLPDFILMDINMPVLDGLQAAKQIMLERPVPIVFLTAYDDNTHVNDAKEIGGCGYLLKPLHNAELTPALDEAFRCYDYALKTGVDDLYFDPRIHKAKNP